MRVRVAAFSRFLDISRATHRSSLGLYNFGATCKFNHLFNIRFHDEIRIGMLKWACNYKIRLKSCDFAIFQVGRNWALKKGSVQKPPWKNLIMASWQVFTNSKPHWVVSALCKPAHSPGFRYVIFSAHRRIDTDESPQVRVNWWLFRKARRHAFWTESGYQSSGVDNDAIRKLDRTVEGHEMFLNVRTRKNIFFIRANPLLSKIGGS